MASFFFRSARYPSGGAGGDGYKYKSSRSDLFSEAPQKCSLS